MLRVEGKPRLGVTYQFPPRDAHLQDEIGDHRRVVRAIAQQLDPLNFEPISPEAVLIRLAMFVSFAWNAGVPPQVIVARFPTPLAQHLGIDPQRLAERLEELHQHGNELAAMLTT